MTAPTEAGGEPMRKKARQAWIIQNMPAEGVDVLNSEFVDKYLAATGAKYKPQPWGAHTCPQLGRDLSAMYRAGLLNRGTIGVGCGFAKWIYVYTKKNKAGAQP